MSDEKNQAAQTSTATVVRQRFNLTGEYHSDCNILIAEIERLENAIKKHKETFPDEALEGEIELWNSLSA